ncbi:DUF6916 family protein [Sphingomonas sp.]|uniref:DUF6916 family protein n=1 Tax=Sphingomonas sp. TaxID=28214 RepID=UPI003B3BC422
MLDLASVSSETFQPHVGSAFELDHPEQKESFTLVEVEPLAARDHPFTTRPSFSLFFNGSSTQIQFNQQILPLKHDVLGAMRIFFVPIAQNADGTIRYQALFN